MSVTKPVMMTVKEFAAVFRVHPLTVRRWEAAGRVQSVRVGGCVRIQSTEIDRLTSNACEPRASQAEPTPGPRQSAARKP